MKGKIEFDIPAHVYHANRTHVSKHGLDEVRENPARFRYNQDHPEKDPTDALIFGRLAHLAVLEPDKYKSETVTAPEGMNRQTKAGKECYAALCEGGKEVVYYEKAKALSAMSAAVYAHPAASALLDFRGVVEASLFWHHDIAGVNCRCRPDWMRKDGIIVDYKTTQDASPTAFAKDAFNLRYHVQAAMYLDGLAACGNVEDKQTSFVFIAQEKEAPYLVACYVASPAMIERGRAEYLADLAVFKHCLENNTWPGYSDRVEEINLPPWVK